MTLSLFTSSYIVMVRSVSPQSDRLQQCPAEGAHVLLFQATRAEGGVLLHPLLSCSFGSSRSRLTGDTCILIRFILGFRFTLLLSLLSRIAVL